MAMFGFNSWNDDAPSSMFGPKEGTWWVTSASAPHWNSNGRGFGLVSMGGPQDAHTWVEHCKEKYGEPPPDLEMGFMKD